MCVLTLEVTMKWQTYTQVLTPFCVYFCLQDIYIYMCVCVCVCVCVCIKVSKGCTNKSPKSGVSIAKKKRLKSCQ